VDSALFIIQKLSSETGNELFRVLALSIDVVSSGNDNGKLEGVSIGSNNELSTSLGSSIWVSGVQKRGFFITAEMFITDFTIDFISRNVDELLDLSVGSDGFQEVMGTHDVILSKVDGVTEGVINMALGGEMNNSVNIVSIEDFGGESSVVDVTLVEGVLGSILNTNMEFRRAVIHLVQIDKLDVSVLVGEVSQGIGTNETASSGDEDGLGFIGMDSFLHLFKDLSDGFLNR